MLNILKKTETKKVIKKVLKAYIMRKSTQPNFYTQTFTNQTKPLKLLIKKNLSSVRTKVCGATSVVPSY